MNKYVYKCVSAYRQLCRFDTSNSKPGLGTTLKSWVKMLMITIRHFVQNNVWERDVPSLTFSTFMSIIPLMAFLFALAHALGSEAVFEDWLNSTFAAQPVVAETLIGFVRNYLANIRGMYIVGVGVVFMLFSIHSLMGHIEHAINHIWNAPSRSLIKKITDYTAVLLFIFILILIGSNLSLVHVVLESQIDMMDELRVLDSLFVQIGAVSFLFCFFLFVYSFIPNTYVKFRNVLAPALFSTMSMILMQHVFLRIQGWLSSYNVVYGSLAALPLFLIWLEVSWAISLFFAYMCYSIQNLHCFDSGVEYDELRQEDKYKVCAMLLHHVCKDFKDGRAPLSVVDLHEKTRLPQQVVNGAVKNLVSANLLIEIRCEDNAAREDLIRFHPVADVSRMTYGLMVKRMDRNGKLLKGFNVSTVQGNQWSRVDAHRQAFLESNEDFLLSEM